MNHNFTKTCWNLLRFDLSKLKCFLRVPVNLLVNQVFVSFSFILSCNTLYCFDFNFIPTSHHNKPKNNSHFVQDRVRGCCANSYIWHLSFLGPLIFYTVKECRPPTPMDPLNYWLLHSTPLTLFSMGLYLETWGAGMPGHTFLMQIPPPASTVLPRGYVAWLQLTL